MGAGMIENKLPFILRIEYMGTKGGRNILATCWFEDKPLRIIILYPWIWNEFGARRQIHQTS